MCLIQVDVRCFGSLNVFEVNGDENMFCFHTCKRHGQLILEDLIHTSVEIVEEVPDDWVFGEIYRNVFALLSINRASCICVVADLLLVYKLLRTSFLLGEMLRYLYAL